MRITTVRIIVQAVAFVLFVVLVALTTFGHLSDHPSLSCLLSKFLEIDPLIAISTSLTTHTLYKGLAWSLIVLIPTLFLGRFFCNWVCPFGIVHHFTGWALGSRKTRERIESNRHKKHHAIKYYILIGMLAASALGSLQVGLLDPIVFMYRAFTINVVPIVSMPLEGVELPGGVQMGDPAVHQYAWLLGMLLILFLGLNLIVPRFFCRVLCPLGALLGLLSRFSIWRIERDPGKCTDCGLCLQSCEGACDPHMRLRTSECFVCMNCVEDCPHDALGFRMFPLVDRASTSPDLGRRNGILAAITGVLFFTWTRSSGKTTRDFSSSAIRPPGSVEELEFLERCVKCDQCVRVCPTNVLQPAMLESGLEGLWTPIMNFRVGHCQLYCTACSYVCPTGAIQHLTPEEKLGVQAFAEKGPVKVGTAHVDFGRCLPWSKNIPCVVCEEVCPVSPKAIQGQYRQMLVRDGKKLITRVNGNALTLADYPKGGQASSEPCLLRPHELKGDHTASYHVRIIDDTGRPHTHRIIDNDSDTIVVEGTFDRPPRPDDLAAIYVELKVPKVDTTLCTGCGLCERECPVVGDRRAIYVTADGETRSQHCTDGDRNRSVSLIRNSKASG